MTHASDQAEVWGDRAAIEEAKKHYAGSSWWGVDWQTMQRWCTALIRENNRLLAPPKCDSCHALVALLRDTRDEVSNVAVRIDGRPYAMLTALLFRINTALATRQVREIDAAASSADSAPKATPTGTRERRRG